MNRDSSISNSNGTELFSQNDSLLGLNQNEQNSFNKIQIKIKKIKALDFGDFQKDIILELVVTYSGKQQ